MKSLLFQIVFKFSSIHDRNFIKLIPVMYRIKLLCLLSFLPIIICGSNYSIIPFPQKLIEKKGNFTLNRHTGIVYSRFTIQEITSVSSAFIQKFQTVSDIQLRINPSSVAQDNTIFIKKNTNLKNTEAYKLLITKSNITIEASTPQGAFYALQTLRQLLPDKFVSIAKQLNVDWLIPCCEIEDAPALEYRGLMLDVCRSFSGVEEVKALIDQLAFLKLNTFHWHLTDDQGWRIEIKKYPLLSQLGSLRQGTQIGHTDSSDNMPYGGFYTQEEARSIVQSAAEHFITVIPEIEMPGHSVAALTAYPQYSCTGGPFEVRKTWGVSDDIFCAGNDSTFLFLQDILTEIIDIFPSTLIHVGGDEAPKNRWKECPKCQGRMQSEGLKNEMELQSYFTRRIEKFLAEKNRRLLGWDEILEGGLPPEATVMSWQGTTGGIAAARQFHDVIMSPGSYCYFDHYQSDPTTEPLAFGGLTTLEKVYSFEPVPAELSSAESKHILGAQCNLWTEYITTPEYLEYMAYPRAIALAEVNWSSKESRNWTNFTKRMQNQYPRLDLKKVNYRREK